MTLTVYDCSMDLLSLYIYIYKYIYNFSILYKFLDLLINDDPERCNDFHFSETILTWEVVVEATRLLEHVAWLLTFGHLETCEKSPLEK